MKKIGRNEPCACGSGKKYKNCHQEIDNQRGSGKKNFIIGGVLALFILLAVAGLYFNNQSSAKTDPGNAPEGKVWSEEHGHWHNAG